MEGLEAFAKELQESFLEEATDLIEGVEGSVLRLEAGECTIQDGVNEVFRMVHTLKGTAKTVGFEALSHFTHKLEDILFLIKANEKLATAQVFNLLIKSFDYLKNWIYELKKNPSFEIATTEWEPTVTILNNILTGKSIQAEESTLELEQAKERKIKQNKAEVDNLANSNNASNRPTDDSIKLPLKKIDELLNYFGEQVILQSTLEQCRGNIRENASAIDRTIVQLSKITYDLQHMAISLRMMSLKGMTQKLSRIVRDTALQTKKQINFTINGADTELDKTMIDELSGALVHLVRNCVDHGIEPAEERTKNGKFMVGQVTLDAYHQAGFFHIDISDDGGGLNLPKIRQIAEKKGLIKANQPISVEENANLIFLPGFSTKESINEISGRGVGMDVVKSTITKLRGNIHIHTEMGKGSRFTIKLPQTLAIFNGLITSLNGKRYILPNSEVKEIHKVKFSDTRITDSDKQFRLIKIGERLMAYVDLSYAMGEGYKFNDNSGFFIVIVVESNGYNYAIAVDDVEGQQRVVSKNLSLSLQGVSGGTILGDGKVGLILDVNQVIQVAHQSLESKEKIIAA